MNKLTFQQPKTKRTQEVFGNETVKIATLKRLGWKQVEPQTGEQQVEPQGTTEQQPTPQGVTEQPESAKTPDAERKTTERIMPEKLSDEGQPPAKNVKRTTEKDQ